MLIRFDFLIVSDLGDQVQLRGYFLWENPFVFGGFIVFNACCRLKHVCSLEFENLRALINEIVLVETWHILPFLPINFINHALHYTNAHISDDQNKKSYMRFYFLTSSL
jgi:hypothetical protein